ISRFDNPWPMSSSTLRSRSLSLSNGSGRSELRTFSSRRAVVSGSRSERPAATSRTASTTAWPRTCLSRSPAALAMVVPTVAASSPHGVSDVLSAHLFEQVTGGAGHDGAAHGLLVVERGEHQAAGRGGLGAQFTAQLDAVGLVLPEPHVHHGHVGLDVHGDGQRLVGAARLRDDLDVGFVAQQLPQAATDDLVVVDEKYLDGHAY